MFMRISDARFAGRRRLGMILLPLALAACGSGQPSGNPGGGVGPAEKIACKPAGAAAFETICLLERTHGGDGLVLTIRHPDGMFRRLLVTRDGRGVIAADGAEQAVVTPMGDREIEVLLGGDAYRLPATVRGSAPATP